MPVFIWQDVDAFVQAFALPVSGSHCQFGFWLKIRQYWRLNQGYQMVTYIKELKVSYFVTSAVDSTLKLYSLMYLRFKYVKLVATSKQYADKSLRMIYGTWTELSAW